MSPNKDTQPLRFAALNYPQSIAVINGNSALSFSQLQGKVDLLCGQLFEQGLRPKDHIIAVSENRLELVCLQLACLQMNLLFCPVSPRFSQKEIAQLAIKLDCQYAWWPALPEGEINLKPININLDAASVGLPTVDTTLKINTSLSINSQQACNIILSSGSTGSPKAVVHSYHNHYASAQGALHCIALSQGDRWLLSLPIYHIGGFAIVMRCLLVGATIVLSSQQDLAKQIACHKVSHLSLVATQLWRLLKVENVQLESIKACIIGGGPVSSELLDQAQKKQLPCFISYGLSEMSSQVATAKANVKQNCGQALPGRELKLVNKSEVAVRGGTLALGYYDKGLKALPLDGEHWFLTGDLAELSSQGLMIKGRSSNMLISGGENIHPEEIEAHLLRLAGIASAVVVAVDNLEFGQRPVAIIEWDYQCDNLLSVEQIQLQLKAVMADFKVPDYFLTWPQSLKNKGLKPNRVALQQFAENRVQGL